MRVSPTQRRALLLLTLLCIGLPGVWMWLSSTTAPPALEAPLTRKPVDVPVRHDLPEPLDSAPTLVRTRTSEDVPPEVAESNRVSPHDALWTLHGTVLTPQGAPAPNAIVGLCELDGNLMPVNDGDRVFERTDSKGQFQFVVAPWARARPLLIFARAHGYAPYSQIRALEVHQLANANTLQLGAGYAVSGQVIRDGAAVVGADISIDVAYGTPGVFRGGQEGWWANGRLEEKVGEASTGGDGSFKISGMGAGEYRMTISPFDEGLPSLVRAAHTVVAPSHQVYDLSPAKLALLVSGPSGTLEGAEITAACKGVSIKLMSQGTPVLLAVPLGEEVELSVREPRFESKSLRVQAPLAGVTQELNIPLDWAQRPSLSVLIPGADDAGVREIRLTLKQSLARSFTERIADAELNAIKSPVLDRFDVQAVPCPQGEYTLLLEASVGAGPGHYLTSQRATLSLPEVGNVEVTFPLELSGRFNLTVPNTKGEDFSYARRVHDASGALVLEGRVHVSSGGPAAAGLDPHMGEFAFSEEIAEFAFEQQTSDANTQSSESPSPDAPRKPPAQWGILPAGTYKIEVECDNGLSWSSPLDIRAGRMVSITAVFEQPKDD